MRLSDSAIITAFAKPGERNEGLHRTLDIMTLVL